MQVVLKVASSIGIYLDACVSVQCDRVWRFLSQPISTRIGT